VRSGLGAMAAIALLSCTSWGDSTSSCLRLTFAEQNQTHPVYSPSGQFIAFIEQDAPGDRGVIITRNGDRIGAAGRGGDRVTCSPSWDPTSTKVCWVTEQGALWTLDEDGTAASASLALPGTPRQVIWQPRGGRVLISTDVGIYSLPVDGSGPPRRLEVHANPRGFSPMSLSSDGGRLAYASDGAIYLTTSPTSPGRAIGSPDSQCHAYTGIWLAPRTDQAVVTGLDQRGKGKTRAFLMDVARGTMAPLDTLNLDADHVTWSTLADSWFALGAGGEILLYDGCGQLLRRLTCDDGAGEYPAFDPHAQCVVYCSSRQPAARDGRSAANLFAALLTSAPGA